MFDFLVFWIFGFLDFWFFVFLVFWKYDRTFCFFGFLEIRPGFLFFWFFGKRPAFSRCVQAPRLVCYGDSAKIDDESKKCDVDRKVEGTGGTGIKVKG